MKALKYIILSMITLSRVCVFAQTSYDAARIIGQDLNGTARYIGMGGAMNAFGNDISVIKSNPAGIGTYKKSEGNMSLSFFGSSTKMTNPGAEQIYLGNFLTSIDYQGDKMESDIKAAFDNLSFVICNESNGYGSLKNTNFAFSYRKLKNDNRTVDNYDDFTELNEFREYGNSEESKINSYDFNISFNHDDIFYWGVTLGLLDASYWSNGYYYHCYKEGSDWLDYTAVDRMNEINAKGFDMSIGAIFRPISNIRLGLSFKSPTWYSVDQTYQDYLYSYEDIETKTIHRKQDPDLFSQSISYDVTTPWVMNMSAGLTYGNTALGFEYEKNFANRVTLRQSGRLINEQGSYDLQDYDTYKVGIEQNIDKISLRAGYSVTSSMFKAGQTQYMGDTGFNGGRRDNESDKLGISRNITCGIGYCSAPSSLGEQFYIDAAYVVGIKKSTLCMGGNDLIWNYKVADYFYPNQFSDYKEITGKLVITAGFTF